MVLDRCYNKKIYQELTSICQMTNYARWGWEKGSVSECKHTLENENPVAPEFRLPEL